MKFQVMGKIIGELLLTADSLEIWMYVGSIPYSPIAYKIQHIFKKFNTEIAITKHTYHPKNV